MALSSHAYRTFAATFEALEAPYYRKETVLQYPGRYPAMDDEPALVPEEFVAEETSITTRICQSMRMLIQTMTR